MIANGRACRRAVLVLRGAAACLVVPTVVRAAVDRRHGPSEVRVDGERVRPSISVVVPARNEADRLAPLLAGLDGAADVIEVIVVDDGSTDATVAVAQARGATVVTATPPPLGWAGKPWALEAGLRAATGDWIVFVDADVRVAADLPQTLVARAVDDRADLLSAAGAFRLPPMSTWLHASMLATLVMRFGAPTGRPATTPSTTLANGQCLAAQRRSLIDAGGWAPVAGHVVEDVALARSFVARGRRVVMVDAADRMLVEPYEDVVAVWRGWGRSLGLPGVEPRWRIAAQAVAVAAVAVVPVVRVVRRRADAFDVALLVLRFGLAAGLRSSYVGREAPTSLAVLASPLADAGSVVALALSAVRRRVRWRGRSIDVVHAVAVSDGVSSGPAHDPAGARG